MTESYKKLEEVLEAGENSPDLLDLGSIVVSLGKKKRKRKAPVSFRMGKVGNRHKSILSGVLLMSPAVMEMLEWPDDAKVEILSNRTGKVFVIQPGKTLNVRKLANGFCSIRMTVNRAGFWESDVQEQPCSHYLVKNGRLAVQFESATLGIVPTSGVDAGVPNIIIPEE